MTNYQRLIRFTVDQMVNITVHPATKKVPIEYEKTIQTVEIRGYRTSDETFFTDFAEAKKHQRAWLLKESSSPLDASHCTDSRLTHRVGEKVFLSRGNTCTLERGSTFCPQANYCSKIEDRTCPYLEAIDKLACLEDAAE